MKTSGFRLKDMKHAWFLYLFMLSLCPQIACGQSHISFGTKFKFPVGEVLEYSLKWGPFKVGSGYLRIEEPVELDGVACHLLTLEVRTNSFADSIYKVRNRFYSYIRADDGRVYRYRIEQEEGKTRRYATVGFDWENLTATYHRDGEEPKEPVSIVDRTWDPLSIAYFSREILDPEQGILEIPATDGKKLFLIEVTNRGAGTIDVQLGKDYPSIRVDPNMREMRGVFEKSKNSRVSMWYSNDGNRYPLLIRSKVIVGSFDAELKKVRLKSDATGELNKDE
jgi:hypothetical protein